MTLDDALMCFTARVLHSHFFFIGTSRATGKKWRTRSKRIKRELLLFVSF